jgi:hypothetical protein
VKKNSFRAWAEARLEETTSFPTSYTRKVKLASGITHDFRLNIHCANTIWLNCGNQLYLLLKDEDYQDQWAEVILADVDGDNIQDLIFTAQSTYSPEPPIKAIFLYRADTWERYFLPPHF